MTTDLTPGSPEWARRVSPSKAAAILGISPWESPRSMWHKMRGEAPWDEESPAMERGNLCEPAVLAWWRKHHSHDGWEEQVTLTLGDWCVATPDGLTTSDGEPVLVEAKTASNMDDWGDPYTDAIPAYYLTQVYLAMEVAARAGRPVTRTHVPVLGGYRLLFSNYIVEYDAAIGAELIDRMRAFYESLTSDTPPDLDDTVATYDAIRKIHPDIEPKAEVEISPAEAREYVEAANAKKAAEARERAAKSLLLSKAGRAQYVTCNGVRIARRQADKYAVGLRQVAKTTDTITDNGENAA